MVWWQVTAADTCSFFCKDHVMKRQTSTEIEWITYDVHLIAIFTARKRSLGQGNVFTPVCHSAHGGTEVGDGVYVWYHFLCGCLVPCSLGGLCLWSPVPSRGSLSLVRCSLGGSLSLFPCSFQGVSLTETPLDRGLLDRDPRAETPVQPPPLW